MTIVEIEVSEDDELLMHNYETLPENCMKYWKKRYEIFAKVDEGVYMTAELWYSVTPEDVAIFTAKLVKWLLPEAKHILDVCCGGGGNAIQFGKLFDSVGAIDINRNNLYCTTHNAGIYDVEDKVWTFEGDWREMAPIGDNVPLRTDWIPSNILAKRSTGLNPFDCAFLSPPWGGPLYTQTKTFDLSKMSPFSLRELAMQMKRYADNYMMFLPKNSNLQQLREVTKELHGEDSICRILYVEQWGKRVAMLALWGPQFTKGDIDYAEIFPEENVQIGQPGDSDLEE